MAAILKALKLDGSSAAGGDGRATTSNVYKSIRNMTGVTVLPVAELNALSVLTPQRLLMTTAALDAFAVEGSEAAKASRVAEASDSGDAAAATSG